MKNTLASHWTNFWTETCDGWHTSVFRILWSTTHILFALYTIYWTQRELNLPPMPYPGLLDLFSLIPGSLIIAIGCVHFLLGCFMLIGWHTRIVQILVCLTALPLFFHSLSLYQNHYGFYLFINFYIALTASQRYYSLDARQKKRHLTQEAFASWQSAHVSLIGVKLAITHLSLLYFFAAINKMQPSWFLRWSESPELASVTKYPVVGSVWNTLIAWQVSWIPLVAVIITMLLLSGGLFVANRYPVIVLVGVTLHLFFDLVLPIMDFTIMCIGILFLALFPIRSPYVKELVTQCKKYYTVD